MKCKKCGKEFNSILSDYCPYCGTDNSFEDDSNFTFLMLVDSIIEDEEDDDLLDESNVEKSDGDDF